MEKLIDKIKKSYEKNNLKKHSKELDEFKKEKNRIKEWNRTNKGQEKLVPEEPKKPGTTSHSGYQVKNNILYATDTRRMFVAPTDRGDGHYVDGTKVECPGSDWKRILPVDEPETVYMFDLKEFSQALKTCFVFAKRSENNPVVLDLNHTKHWLRANCIHNATPGEKRGSRQIWETGGAEIEIDALPMHEGDNHILIPLDCSFVADWIEFCKRQKIDTFTIDFRSPAYPAIFTGGIYQYVLMPSAKP